MDPDEAYKVGDYIPGGDQYAAQWAEDAAAFRELQLSDHLARLDLPYGGGARERFDLFSPRGTPKGLVVFVHGGYWKAFGREDFSHLARGAQLQGWAVALPSYTLAPEARITEITRQTARAITVAAEAVDGPLRLTGHSAGGHQVLRMLDPGLLPEETAARLEKITAISPIGDLRPLRQTSMNDVLGIDEAEAAAESPLLMTRRLGAPVSVWVGAAERPAFLDQARWLGEAWGCPVIEEPGRHHFDVIEGLEDPRSSLMAEVLS